MSDTRSTLELVGSGILGAAYLIYTWHKRRTQFRGRLHHVRVYAGDRELHCQMCDGTMFLARRAHQHDLGHLVQAGSAE